MQWSILITTVNITHLNKPVVEIIPALKTIKRYGMSFMWCKLTSSAFGTKILCKFEILASGF